MLLILVKSKKKDSQSNFHTKKKSRLGQSWPEVEIGYQTKFLEPSSCRQLEFSLWFNTIINSPPNIHQNELKNFWIDHLYTHDI